MGDALFSTPALRALRKKFPEAFISCLIPRRCEDVLKRNPNLDELIVYNERTGFLSPSFWRLAARLRALRFDRAILFHGSGTKSALMRLAKISSVLEYEPPQGRIHKIDHFLNLLSRISVSPDGRTPDFYPDPAAEKALQALLATHGMDPAAPYVVVHAGGNWDLKRWPADYFKTWIRLFQNKFPWKVILCGTASEKKLCAEIVSGFDRKNVFSVCGETSLDMLAVLLKNSKFLLSNDSGPIHLASSQKTKIIGLFGPTDPAMTGPVSDAMVKILKADTGCEVPCYFSVCGDHACMKALTPERVFHETESLERS